VLFPQPMRDVRPTAVEQIDSLDQPVDNQQDRRISPDLGPPELPELAMPLELSGNAEDPS